MGLLSCDIHTRIPCPNQLCTLPVAQHRLNGGVGLNVTAQLMNVRLEDRDAPGGARALPVHMIIIHICICVEL